MWTPLLLGFCFLGEGGEMWNFDKRKEVSNGSSLLAPHVEVILKYFYQLFVTNFDNRTIRGGNWYPRVPICTWKYTVTNVLFRSMHPPFSKRACGCNSEVYWKQLEINAWFLFQISHLVFAENLKLQCNFKQLTCIH